MKKPYVGAIVHVRIVPQDLTRHFPAMVQGYKDMRIAATVFKPLPDLYRDFDYDPMASAVNTWHWPEEDEA